MNIIVKNANELEKIISEVIDESVASWGEGGVVVTLDHCDNGIKIVSDGKNITLYYSQLASLFRGLGVIISMGETEYEISQQMQFKQLGNMLDCSRNAVMKVDRVKQLLRISALLGYNMLQLYTEDTYEIEGEPYFGRNRGRYTQAELKEIDDYAYSLGIEVVPCIQTLAHLDALFNWAEYQSIRDMGDILNVGLDKTFELIEKMFITMKGALRSKQINIGMDEAHHLGHGRYLDMFGYKPRPEIMKEHLEKVVLLCRRYGYEPMIWSDMFFRMYSKTNDYRDKTAVIPEEIYNSVPEGVALVYWDYYNSDKELLRLMFDRHTYFNRNVFFAGGSATWYGFAPMQEYSIENLRAAFDVMRDYKIDTVLNTIWGNEGFECSAFAGLPSFSAHAEGAWCGDLSDESLRRSMSIVGANYDDFMYLNVFHKTPNISDKWALMHKYLLYGDVLQGTWDANIAPGTNIEFGKVADSLEERKANSPKWSYIFEPLIALARVLSSKSELGINLKKAYDSNNTDELSHIANEIIPKTIKNIKELLKKHRLRWSIENKEYGFETQDLRLGGLMARLEHAAETVNRYINGEISTVEECNEPRISVNKSVPDGAPASMVNWNEIVTKGRLFG